MPILGQNDLDYEWFNTLYMPLAYLSEKFEFVNDFYEGYFRPVGVF